MPDPASILVVGGSGMLGQALCRRLDELQRDYQAPSHDRFDVASADCDETFVRLRATAVINASAHTDVAAAETPTGQPLAYRLNRDAPERLALACARLALPLIHVSTDYVFDGTRTTPYTEEDPTAPLQVYGASKLAGEQRVLAACPRAVVARTSTLYGPGRRGRPHYIDAVLEQARTHGALQLVRPPVSSPTYAPDLAAALIELLDVGATGVVHTTNEGQCSRFEFAAAAVRFAGWSGRVELQERPVDPSGLSRPEYSVLCGERYRKLTGNSTRPWGTALQEYVETRV
jgi:dTDP-4-dehydrorhamnose reductase